ncbi:MAG: metal-dependent hydrolase [Sulfuricaulis sp.]
MDTLTHALSGALLARTTEPGCPRPDQLPRRLRLWVGFWAAAFPDSDFIVRFINPLAYLTAHRGITHSIVMLPLWAVGLALLFMLLVRGRYSWRAFVGVCALGIGAHIAGDVITAFGTMIFAPLSHWRASFPTTFIIDPYFTAIIAGGLVASAIWNTTRKPAFIGLALLVGYVGFQAVLHHRAVLVGKAYAAEHRLEATGVEALPQPFSPFNWMIVLPQRDDYLIAYVSLWRDAVPRAAPENANWLWQVYASYYPPAAASWKRVPRFDASSDAAVEKQAWHSRALEAYRRFALFPAVYGVDRTQGSTCVWFEDLRFALEGRSIPFRYGACRNGLVGAWRVHPLFKDTDGRAAASTITH